MSKLHFYKDQDTEKSADGDGTLNRDGFTVKITSGKVVKGHTYTVKQGTSASGDKYPCTTGAEKNGTATFGAKTE